METKIATKKWKASLKSSCYEEAISFQKEAAEMGHLPSLESILVTYILSGNEKDYKDAYQCAFKIRRDFGDEIINQSLAETVLQTFES